jgi:hypothetical protein
MHYRMQNDTPSAWPSGNARSCGFSQTVCLFQTICTSDGDCPIQGQKPPIHTNGQEDGRLIPKNWAIDGFGWTILTDLTEQPVVVYSKFNPVPCPALCLEFLLRYVVDVLNTVGCMSGLYSFCHSTSSV